MITLAIVFLIFSLLYFTNLTFLFYGGLLVFWFDFTLGLGAFFYGFLRPISYLRNLSLILTYIGLFAAISLATFFLRNYIAKFALVIFVVTFATTIISMLFFSNPIYRETSSLTPSNKPVPQDNVLMMILDEHIGLDGFPKEIQEASALRTKLIRTYAEQGFLVYGQAFSNYQWTTSSLYNIFNGADSNFDPRVPLKFEANKILQKLSLEGYSVRVYESTWVDLCSKNTPCARFIYRHDCAGYLHNLPLTLNQKLSVIADQFIFGYKSLILQTLVRFKLNPQTANKKLAATSTEHVIGKLLQDLRLHQHGQVFVVHLSLPHNPYMFDKSCQLKDPSTWENHSLVGRRQKLIPSWKRKYELYFEQVECVHAEVKKVIDQLHQEKLFDETTVILFGDHGSRIAMEEKPDRMIDRDYLDWFSAFLVVKPASSEKQKLELSPGYTPRKISLQSVINSYFGIASQTRDPMSVCVFYKNQCSYKQMVDFPKWTQ